MLAREKKRVAWSLAIGALCASAILGWEYREARIVDSRLPALIQQCEADARKVTAAPAAAQNPSVRTPAGRPLTVPELELMDLEPALDGVCEPDALAKATLLGGYYLTSLQQEIADKRGAQSRSMWLLPTALFAVFCLPLIWYFLLDRVRELGAAISGRDRNP